MTPETLQRREAEEARFAELQMRRERFEPPAAIRPVSPWNRMLERFEILTSNSGGKRIRDRETNAVKVFVNDFWGGVAALEWMREQMADAP
jgi:hypothetical protein